jgi:hypothetical protein
MPDILLTTNIKAFYMEWDMVVRAMDTSGDGRIVGGSPKERGVLMF